MGPSQRALDGMRSSSSVSGSASMVMGVDWNVAVSAAASAQGAHSPDAVMLVSQSTLVTGGTFGSSNSDQSLVRKVDSLAMASASTCASSLAGSSVASPS